MSDYNQHDLGLAGLALLRTWLVGDREVTKEVFSETYKITKALEQTLNKKDINTFSVSEGYQNWAETYDNIPNLLIEVEEPAVKNLLQKYKPGQVLDAACGTGRYSKFLKSLGHKVVGVDASKDMLNKAKLNDGIEFLEGDLNSLPIEDNTKDLAICALALTHLPDIYKTISELTRVVKPNGTIIISDINPWLVALGGQADFYDKAGRYGYVKNYIHWHSEYIDAFYKNNLKLVNCFEPKLEKQHLDLAKKGFNLSIATVGAALLGLPIGLVWVLEKN